MKATQAPTKAHLVVLWPPQIINTTSLGYMRNVSGNSYPRDIGRSSVFSDGSVFVQFGDTFCHNIEGDFIGLADNTCAIVVDPKVNPILLSYAPTRKKSDPNGNDPISNFIGPFGFLANTRDWHNEIRSVDLDFSSEVQIKLWSFSGIVENERTGDVISAWTWFEKRTITPENLERYIYTGVAEVKYWPDTKKIHTLIEPGYRLFEVDEPGLGGFCAVCDGELIYVYGHLLGSKDVAIGRVRRALAGERSAYRFLTQYGSDIDGPHFLDGVWSDQIKKCTSVQGLQNMQHGQIFRTEMYPSSLHSPWAFVGCNATGDSQVIIGRSRAPEGPFTTVKLMAASPLMQMPSGSYTYCMYPHPWASDIKTGDLMISWSEGSMNGSVIAVIARLKTVRDGEEAGTSVVHPVDARVRDGLP